MHRSSLLPACIIVAVVGASCRSASDSAPPPDVGRPVLRTEAELAAERERRIQGGEVVTAAAPTFDSERPRGADPAPPAPPPLLASRDSISGDILLVNNSVLTVAEVLYQLRDQIAETRGTLTRPRFRERLESWVLEVAQQDIGVLLVYEKAMVGLDEARKEALAKTVERELDKIVNLDFGGSNARLTSHLTEHGLTLDKYRERIQRQLVVSSYSREIIAPRIHLRRDELLRRYRENQERYASPETRELMMIEAPFEKFLPEGTSWDRATPDQKARARLAAVRHIRAAAEALRSRPFEDVAREFSRGVHAESGGSWGMIGKPLQPPYEEATARIFRFSQGQTSEPIETVTGWCIVRCGEIQPAVQKSFQEVQETLREEVFRERFNKLASEYMLKLARDATISSMDHFVAAAVRKAMEE